MTVRELIKQLKKLPQDYTVDIPYVGEDDNLYCSEIIDLISLEDEQSVSFINESVAMYNCDACPHCIEENEEKQDPSDLN